MKIEFTNLGGGDFSYTTFGDCMELRRLLDTLPSDNVINICRNDDEIEIRKDEIESNEYIMLITNVTSEVLANIITGSSKPFSVDTFYKDNNNIFHYTIITSDRETVRTMMRISDRFTPLGFADC